jgi:hypothetical protein
MPEASDGGGCEVVEVAQVRTAACWHVVHCSASRVMLYYAHEIDYLGPPVRGSTGLSGHSAAPIVRPSSVRRLYVDAALRWGHQSWLIAP